MHTLNLQLPEPLYAEIAQAAAASGQSVEEVVIDQLAADFSDDLPASFWTPELLASIDAAREEAAQGGGISLDEMRERTAARSRAWRECHPA